MVCMLPIQQGAFSNILFQPVVDGSIVLGNIEVIGTAETIGGNDYITNVTFVNQSPGSVNVEIASFPVDANGGHGAAILPFPDPGGVTPWANSLLYLDFVQVQAAPPSQIVTLTFISAVADMAPVTLLSNATLGPNYDQIQVFASLVNSAVFLLSYVINNQNNQGEFVYGLYRGDTGAELSIAPPTFSLTEYIGVYASTDNNTPASTVIITADTGEGSGNPPAVISYTIHALSVTPNPVTCPNTAIGTSSTAQVIITNSGLDCVTITGFADAAPFSVTNPVLPLGPDGIELDPSGTLPVTVEFTPTSDEQVSEDIPIVCSAANAGTTSIACQGLGITPTFEFWIDKNTFGYSEVSDSYSWPQSFALVLDGYSQSQLSDPTPTFPSSPGTFLTIPGVTVSPSAVTTSPWQDPSDMNTPQRWAQWYDITFTSASLSSFPPAGAPEAAYPLQASLVAPGGDIQAATLIELVPGGDPYFTNVSASADNPSWLSQDLRVFVVTPGLNSAPVMGAPAFSPGDPSNFEPDAAYTYIQGVLTYLNDNFSDPSNGDPFSIAIPQQSAALTGDSSVTPTSPNPSGGNLLQNYNFAVARVRLKGPNDSTASDVRVFFRLFATQSNDTDYQPTTTYLSTNDPAGFPSSPAIGAGNPPTTYPFFATGGPSTQTDYVSGGPNNRTLTISPNEYVWAYFGCFLDVYDPNYVAGGLTLPGTHHCLVAQIAYDEAPIVNSNGITMSPGNSDKLAQRNLQITASDNPGSAAAHRIPQTFDLRPSQGVTQLPDELAMFWGNVPLGSRASIYWPQVPAVDVIALADSLYGPHQLSIKDSHTITTTVGTGACYVPIVAGAAENIAGLLTLDLPMGVQTGELFTLVVRRISQRAVAGYVPEVDVVAGAISRAALLAKWRYVVGTFQISIPVADAAGLLEPEETTLSILQWRLAQMASTNRWHPVLRRYIEFVADRVNALGGDALSITASATGQPAHPSPGVETRTIGKVTGMVYDRFGDFSGFWLRTQHGGLAHYAATEPDIESIVRFAWDERILIEVVAPDFGGSEPTSIVLLRH